MRQWILAITSGLGAMLAIGTLAYADLFSGQSVMWLMAPFGASAVIVFGLPDSPLARPYNVIAGHLLTATIGLVGLHVLGLTPWSLALACGLSVTAMLLTKSTHPPAGANPLVVMLTGQSWLFLVSPVLLGALVIVLLGWGFRVSRRYYA